MADLNVISDNLAELLTNTVDMAGVFYDIFINPTPMDVELKMFDDNNRLITVVVPNRAKDRITPYTGQGSPEGVVSAPIGSVYVDIAASTVFYKVSGSGNTGWSAIISQSAMETYIRNYLESRGYLTSSSLNTYLTDNGYVTTATTGNLSSLTTTVKTNLVGAINDVNATIGDLSHLGTLDKSSIVNALNEVLATAAPTSFDTINNSKGALTGANSDNSRIISDIISYKHSTFENRWFIPVSSISISDEGIASGFSNSRYIRLSRTISSGTSNFVIELPVYSLGPGIYTLCSFSGANNEVLATIQGSNIIVKLGNATVTLSNLTSIKLYRLRISVASGNLSAFLISQDNQIVSQGMESIGSLPSYVYNQLYLGVIADHTSTYPYSGQIDLKYFSVYVDGVPYFSGNITGTDTYDINGTTVKIPYTLSKTGSKIVDMAYRDRVESVYNKNGAALYYLLDEFNVVFALPQGEIYGMIRKGLDDIKTDLDTKLDTKLDKDSEKLHSLKAYLDEGEYLTDREGYLSVESLVHSYFSHAKFTFVPESQEGITINGSWMSAPANGSYVSVPFEPAASTNYTLKFSYRTPATFDNNHGYVIGGENCFFELYKGDGNSYSFYYKNSSSSSTNVWTVSLQASTVYDFKFEFNITTRSLVVGYKVHEYNSYSTRSTTMASTLSTTLVSFLYGDCAGEVNLASIIIFAETEPVFEGPPTEIDTYIINGTTIEIPCTWAFTGGKIVHACYKNKVDQLKKLIGSASYYIIDEFNERFALPQGDLYGLIRRAGNDFSKPDFETAVSIFINSGTASVPAVTEYDIPGGGWMRVRCEYFHSGSYVRCFIDQDPTGLDPSIIEVTSKYAASFQVNDISGAATVLWVPVQVGQKFYVQTNIDNASTQNTAINVHFLRNRGA